MASSSEVRLIIGQLRRRLIQSSVFAAGRPDSPEKAQQEAARLEKIGETLEVIIRDLNSSESLIGVREAGLRKIPHDRRWSARQSLSQLSEDLHELKLEAKALAELVRDLLIRDGVLNPIQKAKDVIDLMDELQKTSAHEMSAQIAMLRRETTMAPVPHGGSSSIEFTGVVSALAFAYLGSKVLARKFGKKN